MGGDGRVDGKGVRMSGLRVDKGEGRQERGIVRVDGKGAGVRR